jgi:PAS domain S-box-containing protein
MQFVEALTIASDPAARFRVIAENARDIVVQMDRDALILYASPSVRTMGYSPEEVIGRHGPDFVHPEDLQRLRDYTALVLKGGHSEAALDRRYRFRRKDGGYCWYEGNPSRLFDESHAVVGLLSILRDVNESVLATEAMAQSEALYRLLADNLSDVVVRLDMDGRISYASPSWRTLGYAPEEVIGRQSEAFVHPDDIPKLRDCVASILAGGPGATDRRYRLRTKDGSYRLHEGSPSQATDEAGRIVGVINVLRDVTAQVAAADALAASEARYRLLAEHMSDIIVTLDVEGRIQYVSPSVRTLGYTPEELIGRDRSEFIHTDEVPRLIDNMAHLRSGVLDRRRDRTHRIRLKQGGYRWYDGAPNPITDENGVVVAVVNVMRDVHDIKAAEEILAASEARYRLLADNMGDIIACYGRDGVLTFVSGATKATLGYEPAELLGRSVDSMIHPDDLGPAAAQYRHNFQKGVGASPFHIEYRLIRSDGSIVWLEAYPRAHYGPDGVFVEWQDVIRDITGHKALEEELRAARRVADAATKTKAGFLADMSHELRGPLNSIASFSRLARDRPAVPVSVRTALERIESASIDLIGMVNDILDFSKLEAAEVVFRKQPVSVAELARAAVGLLEPQAHEKGLELLLLDRTPAGLIVSLDQGRVRQVVLNLLGNAIKFTHSGRVSLQVRHDPDKRRLLVDVRDTGPGIPTNRLGQLFDRFTQVSEDGAEAYGGAGLGLAISKAIVEGLGGKISVETKTGHGSCFSFWIPAAPTTATFDDDKPAPRLRILVAHADEEISGLVATALAPLKVEVSTASDGESASRLAARGGFDVILADLELVRRGGATTRRLGARRGRQARIPVVALSPTASDALYATVLEEGFQGLVATPFTASDLTSAITYAFAFDTGLA